MPAALQFLAGTILPWAALPSFVDLVLAATVGALAVLLSARLPHTASAEHGLVRPAARAKLRRTLPWPDADARLIAVSEAMLPLALPELRPPLPGEPPSPDHVVARALARILEAWDLARIDQATPDQIIDLAAFVHLVHLAPSDASALAMHFNKPAQMLEIRDQIAALTRYRTRFDRQQDTYQAARGLWMMRRGGKLGEGLLPLLRGMSAPDPDLWHHVVTRHDPADPHQRRAALWCLTQTDCARATAAAWLADLADSGQLATAARTRDTAFADALAQVVQRWNDDEFGDSDIGLDPPDTLARSTTALCAGIAGLSDALGGAALPMPRRLFDGLPGRPAQPRDNWCLETGTLTAPPRREDFVEPPPMRVAG